MTRDRRITKDTTKEVQAAAGSGLSDLMVFAERNMRQLIIGAAVIVIVVVAVLVWKYLDARQENQASEALHRALALYEETASDTTTSLDEPLQAFQTVLQDYQGTPSAGISAFYAATCLYKEQKFDEAIAFYERFLKSVPQESRLHVLAYDSLGYCYEQKKEYAKANEYFLKTITTPPGLGEVGYLNIARSYRRWGTGKKAWSIISVQQPNILKGSGLDSFRKRSRHWRLTSVRLRRTFLLR